MSSSPSPPPHPTGPVSHRLRRGRPATLLAAGVLAVAAAAVALTPMTSQATEQPGGPASGGDPCHDLTFYVTQGNPAATSRYDFQYSFEIGGSPDGTRYWRYVHDRYEWAAGSWQPAGRVTTWYCTTPGPVPASGPTPGPASPTPSASASEPADVTCGDQTFPRQQAVELALAAGLTDAQAQEFAADPCDVSVTSRFDEVLIADDGTDEAVVAGPGGPAPCRVATGRVRLVTHLNRFIRDVELASYRMAVYFCYDGSQVWKKGNRNEPPPEAAIQDIQYTGPGKVYQVEYTGVASSPATFGWSTWSVNGNEKGAAFTIMTTNWTAGLPILKWAIPEHASVTKTLSVYADGSSSLT